MEEPLMRQCGKCSSLRVCLDCAIQSTFCKAAFTSEHPAQASIWGPEDVYVKKGSTISLTCSVNVHSTPPGSVFWYHGASVVDFDSPRGGISLETEKTGTGTTSKLLVTKASLLDSGNYTCVPSNANPASVYVHVLNAGEYPAAIHGDHGCGTAVSPCALLFAALIILSWR
ncbi:hypothetical protein GE061_013639 [Apolygus lucorum]|uniref:Uncharacterized protein n=1 Tax=Apolygus lucorum TaxID=248454 RepID=A0A6A4K0W9_APOLU|nr:hypothetical protein GE061_013639 [Apolygus lucorum]